MFHCSTLPLRQLFLLCLTLFLLPASAPAQPEPAPVRQAAQRKSFPNKQRSKLTRDELIQAEIQLYSLGYWTGPLDGHWDTATRHALIAFQKVEGRPPAGQLSRSEYEALLSAEPPSSREAGEPHIEVDLRRQVLFVVEADGVVTKVLPVSTGNGKDFVSNGWERAAITPPGRFQVERQIAGWRQSELGWIYYPNYIFKGIAIHGSASVPARPASHGCVRIPLFAAAEFSRLVSLGMPVVVYDGVTPLPSFAVIIPAGLNGFVTTDATQTAASFAPPGEQAIRTPRATRPRRTQMKAGKGPRNQNWERAQLRQMRSM
jgi:lipoprotein-anchoring transpeptidase ErfK/SrfK